MLYRSVRDTSIGKITIGADDEAVVWLVIGEAESFGHSKIIDNAFAQLEEYLEGKRKVFDVPLKLQGTDFQVKVWETLRQIPFGHTISYGDLAELSGYPRAARAVGTAMRDNRIPVFIPCHRVIAAGGKIGGFSCGLDVKMKLLQLEGVSL